MFIFIVTPIAITILSSLIIFFFLRKPSILIPCSLTIFVVCSINSLIFYYIGTLHSRYNEIWNYKIVSMEHQERWSTEERKTRKVKVGEDEDGDPIYKEEVYYVTEYHGPYFYIFDEYSRKTHSNEQTYNSWKYIWNNENKTGQNIGSAAFPDMSISGGIFEINWDNKFETIFPFEETHVYTNKVRATKNTFNFAEPSKENIKKFPRPADKDNINPIICYGTEVKEEDIMFVRRLNAYLGTDNQIRILFIIFNGKEYDRGIVDNVLSAWKGVNKNELVIFIGEENNNIKWICANSWMDDTTLHSLIETNFYGKELNIKTIGEFLFNNVSKYWKRKQFADFSYLSIEISWICKVFLILVSSTLSIFIIKIWEDIDNINNNKEMFVVYTYGYKQFRR